jgi:hypothetical protein
MKGRDNRVPHPHSPAGRNFNWGDIGLPHPDSPAGREFDYTKYLGVKHPNSPAARSVFEESGFRSLEYKHGIDEGQLQSVFDTGGHSFLALKSFQAVYGPLSRRDDPSFTPYRLGFYWPDFPTDDPNSGKVRHFFSFALGYLKGLGENSVVYRSHYGDLQFWHSMTPTSAMTNAQVLEKIIAQAREWYGDAISQNNVFHIGKLNHMVTDAYPRGHVLRDTKDNVVSFRTYNAANKEQGHSRQDIFNPGSEKHMRALAAATTVLQFYKQRLKFSGVEDYLRKLVYRFAEGAANRRSGDDLPSRAPELGGPRDVAI